MAFLDYSPLAGWLGHHSKPAPTALDGYYNMKGNADRKMGRQNKLFDENNAGLDWITGGAGGGGDPTKGPLYQSFLTKSRSAISNSYDNAMINSRRNAGARGFGYASPNEQTGELGMRGSEASALGQAPSQALQETMPYDMEAMGMRADEAKAYGGEALGEEGMANQDLLTHDKNKQKNQSDLYGGLANLASLALMA